MKPDDGQQHVEHERWDGAVAKVGEQEERVRTEDDPAQPVRPVPRQDARAEHAVDATTGGVLAEITVDATAEGYAALVEFADEHATVRLGDRRHGWPWGRAFRLDAATPVYAALATMRETRNRLAVVDTEAGPGVVTMMTSWAALSRGLQPTSAHLSTRRRGGCRTAPRGATAAVCAGRVRYASASRATSDGAGELSLAMGIVAVAFSFFPIVGEFVAAPASVLAVISGSIGISRVDRGLATNPGRAWLGIGLGVTIGFMTLLVFVATSDMAA